MALRRPRTGLHDDDDVGTTRRPDELTVGVGQLHLLHVRSTMSTTYLVVL